MANETLMNAEDQEWADIGKHVATPDGRPGRPADLMHLIRERIDAARTPDGLENVWVRVTQGMRDTLQPDALAFLEDRYAERKAMLALPGPSHAELVTAAALVGLKLP